MSAAQPVYGNLHAPEPVLHLSAGHQSEKRPRGDGWEWRSWWQKSYCGIVLYSNEWYERPQTHDTLNYKITKDVPSIRRDHGEKIGRICAKCLKAEAKP
jgi:hypothetical protein